MKKILFTLVLFVAMFSLIACDRTIDDDEYKGNGNDNGIDVDNGDTENGDTENGDTENGDTDDNDDTVDNDDDTDEITLDGVIAYETSFEDHSGKSAYALDTATIDNVEWSLEQTLIGNHENETRDGSYALRGRKEGFAQINQSFSNLQGFEFMFARTGFSDDGLGVLSAEVSSDGVMWHQIMEPTNPESTTFVHVQLIINYDDFDFTIDDSLYIRIVFSGPSGAEQNDTRLNVDNFKVYTVE